MKFVTNTFNNQILSICCCRLKFIASETFTCACCLRSLQLCVARAGSVFQPPVYVLFWGLEKCYPEGLLEFDGVVCLLPSFSFYNSTPPHVLVSFPLPLSSCCISLSLSLFFVSYTLFLSRALSQAHLFALSLTSGYILTSHIFFPAPLALTPQWLRWCLLTSTYSCLLSSHPIIFMAWGSMCTKSFAMTWTGGLGPSSLETLSLTGWGIQMLFNATDINSMQT